MQHALYIPPFGDFGDVHRLVALAQMAEEAGWDGVYLWDHVLFAIDVPFVDPWIALAAIASSTERVRLGPLVTPLARRRPWKVAREAVTLDHLSHGRLTLGVGLGIDFWREYGAFNEVATSDRIRAELVDDGIEIIRALWTGEPVTYQGARHTVDGARFLPTPRQPRIPIWSAALWPLNPGPTRRAARCDGVMPFNPNGIRPDDVVQIKDAIAAHRTAPEPFDICLHGPPEDAADYAAAGVTWFCMSFRHEEDDGEVERIVKDGPPRV